MAPLAEDELIASPVQVIEETYSGLFHGRGHSFHRLS